MLWRRKFGKTAVTSLVERVGRFTAFSDELEQDNWTRFGAFCSGDATLPLQAHKSVTFGRDSEFMDWPPLQAEGGAQTWFCNPSDPWQKGTVENTNRRASHWRLHEVAPTTISNCQGFS